MPIVSEPSYGTRHSDHSIYLNINISDNNELVFKIYNKTDNNFDNNFNKHSNITYSALYFQLFRCARKLVTLILKIDVKRLAKN